MLCDCFCQAFPLKRMSERDPNFTALMKLRLSSNETTQQKALWRFWNCCHFSSVGNINFSRIVCNNCRALNGSESDGSLHSSVTFSYLRLHPASLQMPSMSGYNELCISPKVFSRMNSTRTMDARYLSVRPAKLQIANCKLHLIKIEIVFRNFVNWLLRRPLSG